MLEPVEVPRPRLKVAARHSLGQPGPGSAIPDRSDRYDPVGEPAPVGKIEIPDQPRRRTFRPGSASTRFDRRPRTGPQPSLQLCGPRERRAQPPSRTQSPAAYLPHDAAPTCGHRQGPRRETFGTSPVGQSHERSFFEDAVHDSARSSIRRLPLQGDQLAPHLSGLVTLRGLHFQASDLGSEWR